MTIRQIPHFLIILLGIFFALRIPSDPDVWWHLRTGEYVVENGIPDTDPFTYTVNDVEWGMHEWLSDVTMYLIWDAVGFDGLAIIFAGLIGLAVALIYFNTSGRPYLAFLITLWSLIVILPSITARPNIFNFLGGAFFIFILDRWRHGQIAPRWLWSIPVATLLWVNLHSGFLLGISIILVYLIGGYAEHYLRPQKIEATDLNQPQLRLLLTVFAVTCLVSLINPNIVEIWWFPIKTHFSNSAILSQINEWKSPDFGNPFFLFLGSMMIGGFALLPFSREKVTYTEILLYAGLAGATLLSRRNMLFFVIVATPILARHLLAVLHDTRAYAFFKGDQPAPSTPPAIAFLNVAVIAILTIGVLGQSISALDRREEVVAEKYPVAAVDYLEANDLGNARIFSWFGWGGYLIWRDIPTFIDGRADLFDSEFFEMYTSTENAHLDWAESLDTYEVTIVLFPNKDFALVTALTLSPEWEEIYHDEVSFIFRRINASDESTTIE